MRLVKHLAVTCLATVSVDVAIVNSVAAQELVDNGSGVTEEYRVRYRSRPEYDAQAFAVEAGSICLPSHPSWNLTVMSIRRRRTVRIASLHS